MQSFIKAEECTDVVDFYGKDKKRFFTDTELQSTCRKCSSGYPCEY